MVNRIRTVKRIIKAAPTRIGGVDGKARIFHRHDQLRAGDFGNLIIDILRVDCKIRTFRHQIADFFEKRLISGRIMRLALACLMPIVDLHLQGIALCQQCLIGIAMRVQHLGHGGPKAICRDIRAFNGFISDKIRQLAVNLQTRNLNACAHSDLLMINGKKLS